jgi:hypothetical protein
MSSSAQSEGRSRSRRVTVVSHREASCLTHVRSPGFDREFIRQQIEDHKQDLIALKMFGGAAKDDDLKEDIKHLTRCSSDTSHAREPSRRSSGCRPIRA